MSSFKEKALPAAGLLFPSYGGALWREGVSNTFTFSFIYILNFHFSLHYTLQVLLAL